MSDFSDAINAINEKIVHHSGLAKKHQAAILDHQKAIEQQTQAASIHETAVVSLRSARKILTDAETTRRIEFK